MGLDHLDGVLAASVPASMPVCRQTPIGCRPGPRRPEPKGRPAKMAPPDEGDQAAAQRVRQQDAASPSGRNAPTPEAVFYGLSD